MSALKSPELLEFENTKYEPVRWSGDTIGWWIIAGIVFLLSLVGFGFIIPGIQDETVAIALSCSTATSVLLTFIFLILVERIDPGVVPPKPVKDSVIALAELGISPPDLSQDEHGQWVRTRLSKTGEVQTIERYCITCNIWRQPRTSHCRKCGYCMERFDHHCNALGTCVAKKNHRFFIALLIFGSISSALLMVACVLRIRQKKGTFSGAEWRNRETFALAVLAFIYMYLGFIFLFGLFHCAILVCDITTKQYLKKSDYMALGPIQSSWATHFHGIFCSEVRSKYSVEKQMSRKQASDVVGHMPIRRETSHASV